VQYYEVVRESLVSTARNLTTKGYLMATGGNLSVRVPDGHDMLITPSNSDYMTMQPKDICQLDQELRQREGPLPPSVESAMHSAIYRMRPDVMAIIHTHQVYASAVSLTGKGIPALFDEQARFLGRTIELIPYAPSGTASLARLVARRVRSRNNAYLMQNHGAICFGLTLERAVHNVEILEKCALAWLLSLCTSQTTTRIPLVVREVAFAKLKADYEKHNTEPSFIAQE